VGTHLAGGSLTEFHHGVPADHRQPTGRTGVFAVTINE